jgi:hypothetical protein
MSVNVHVHEATVIESTVRAAENRATVVLDDREHYLAKAVLFGDRAQLVRLRDALIAVVDELDAARAALAESLRTDESAA